jgi:hypothetical protein
VSVLAFFTATATLHRLTIPLPPLFLIVVVALLVTLRLLPSIAGSPAPRVGSRPRWDLPARMLVATGFVVLLTGAAPALGPQLTGLLSAFPLFTATLVVFAHALEGRAAATRVVRGTVLGMFGFAGFALMLAALTVPAGLAPAFAAAAAVALAFQAGSLWALRRIAERGSDHPGR